MVPTGGRQSDAFEQPDEGGVHHVGPGDVDRMPCNSGGPPKAATDPRWIEVLVSA